MTPENKITLLVGTIREEIEQLERWAYESIKGGWSTHQVQPMRKRAALLREALFELEGK